MTLRAWFALLVFVALTMPHGLPGAQSAVPDIVTARGTVVSRGAASGTWLFELDRGLDVVAGHVRSVSLFVDETSGPAHPIGVGDRLDVEGRLLTPTLPGDLGSLLPARIAAVAEALSLLRIDEGVIKPLIGASGFGVERVRRGEEAEALARASAHKTLDRVLVQEFVHGIDAGEQAGVFVDGVFSHGLRRTAAPGEFRINTQYGGRIEATLIAPEIVDQMRSVLRRLPAVPVYCHVDGVVQNRELVVMEVEVNEPGLGLDLAAASADRFADALLRRL